MSPLHTSIKCCGGTRLVRFWNGNLVLLSDTSMSFSRSKDGIEIPRSVSAGEHLTDGE